MSTYDFFISYRRRASLPLAEEIARVLSADVPGYRVFFDKEELKFSRKWQDQINESMTSSRAVIAILGRCSFCDVCGKRHPDEDKFLHELRLAREGGREIIPISFRGFMKHELHRVPDDELRAFLGDKGPSAIIAEEWFIKKDSGRLAEHVNEEDQENSSVVQIDDKKAIDTVVKAMMERYGRDHEYLNDHYVRNQTAILRSMIHDRFKTDATLDPGERREIEAYAVRHFLRLPLVDQLIDEKARSLTSAPHGPRTEVKPAVEQASEEAGLTSARQLATALTSRIGADAANRVKASLGKKHATGELSAQDVNALLETLGLQVKGLDGWALTKDGGVHGSESVGRGAGGEAIRMLRWRASVLDVLAEEIGRRARSAAASAGEIAVNVDPVITADTTAALERATRAARERGPAGTPETSTTSASVTPDDDDDLYQTLGAFTVKRALAEDASGFIATVTGRSETAVRRALGGAAPNTRIANLFDEIYDPEVVGALTAKAAITCGVIGTIAEYLDLARPEVKRRLKAVHGRTAVANVFANEWEPDDEARRRRRVKPPAPLAETAPQASPSSSPSVSADEVELALLREEVIAAAADGIIEMMEHHHLRRRAVFLGLADDENEAIALVTRLIHEVAPGVRSEPDGAPVEGDETHADGGYDAIGALCARDVDDNIAWAIAELCGYEGTKGVRRRTNKSPDALVRDLFNERWDHAGVLGALTVARARVYQLAAPLARLSGLPESEVRNRLDAVKHGKTLVRNVVFPMSQAPVSTPAGADASTSFGRMVDSFIRSLPEAQRRVADWFLAAATGHGQTPKKPRDRTAIELQEWTAELVFSDAGVTFETGYDADDVTGELAHHVAAMRAIPGAERLLQGPGQPRQAPTYRVEIGDVEALDVARLVFEAFATASEDDDQEAEG